MWESHSNANDRCNEAPTLIGTRSVCTVSNQTDGPVGPVAAVEVTPPVGLAELETLLSKLLPKVTPPVTGARPVRSVSNQPVDLVAMVGETSPVELTAVYWHGRHRLARGNGIDAETLAIIGTGPGAGVGTSVDGQYVAVSTRTIMERLHSGNDDLSV